MENLETLLQKVRQINDQFENIEKFNAFTAIGFFNQERMHSNFIAEMLNPKGKHKMNNQFLKLFLQQVPLKNKNFYIDNATAAVEQRAESRWIDIMISNGKKEVIVIENKIYAGDQDRQLEDYYNFCKKDDNHVEMIYLTLNGKKPTPKSVGPVLQMEDVICISYEKHILPWINECAGLTGLPIRLKCTLEMYSELLCHLINKNKIMNAIFEEIKKDESLRSLRSAIDIRRSLTGINYIKEYPHVTEYLKKLIEEISGVDNPYLYNSEGSEYLAIADEECELKGWNIAFEENEVYAVHDVYQQKAFIPLFNPKNIDDQKLQSLIFQDGEYAEVWISQLIINMKEKTKQFYEPSQSI